MSKRVYLAAAWMRKNEMRETAFALRNWGFEVTSTWHDSHQENAIVSDEAMQKEAIRDYYEIQNSDILIRFADDLTNVNDLHTARKLLTAGRMVEMGIALTAGVGVAVIGPHQCVFDYLPFVDVYPSLEAFINDYQG